MAMAITQPTAGTAHRKHAEAQAFLGAAGTDNGNNLEATTQPVSDPTEDSDEFGSPGPEWLPETFEASNEITGYKRIAEAGGGLSGMVTAMLKNVPMQVRQRTLMRAIERAGFKGAWDYFYLPMDQRNQGNRGFLFINFKSPQKAEAFYRSFHGRYLPECPPGSPPVVVLPADVQGFDANALRYAEQRLCLQQCGKRTKFAACHPIFMAPLPPGASQILAEEERSRTRKMRQPRPVATDTYGYGRQGRQPLTAYLRQSNSNYSYPADTHISGVSPAQYGIKENFAAQGTKDIAVCWRCGHHLDLPGFDVCKSCMLRERQTYLSASDPSAPMSQAQFDPTLSEVRMQLAEPMKLPEPSWATTEASWAPSGHCDIEVIGHLHI